MSYIANKTAKLQLHSILINFSIIFMIFHQEKHFLLAIFFLFIFASLHFPLKILRAQFNYLKHNLIACNANRFCATRKFYAAIKCDVNIFIKIV